MSVTPMVFWAVVATIAVVPQTPQRRKALRSAWIPAPAPESLVATLMTRFKTLHHRPGSGLYLAPRRLRLPKRAQEHDHHRERYDEARHEVGGVVCHRVDVRVPPFRGVGGEEDHPGDEVAQEAGKDGDHSAEDGAPHRGQEQTGKAHRGEGEGV